MPDLGRTRQAFDTRQYRHRYAISAGLADRALAPGRVYRFIAGRDQAPAALAMTDAPAPADAFARSVLFGDGALPLTLRALRDRLGSTPGGAALGVERVFLVAEGGQVRWSEQTDALKRGFRFLVTRAAADGAQPDVLVSASVDLDSASAFLQVLAWDATAGAYQFYDRREGAWIWAGSSWDALSPDSRGNGPFDSHVNGALNMKEMKRPWVHWHSQASPIRDDALAPDDPLRNEPMWLSRRQAEEFERTVVRPGIERWTSARFDRLLDRGRLPRFREFMRQVLETTTVNLASSSVSNAALGPQTAVQLPLTFFFNADALIGKLEIEPDIAPLRVAGSVYAQALRDFDVGITDGSFRFAGDTQFLFIVPEPAHEDLAILEQLLDRDIMEPRLAAALLMVDFCNPVYSPRRASLMKYVPDEATVGAAAQLEATIVGAVRASAAAADARSPEAEFLANIAVPVATWKDDFAARITAFVASAAASLASAGGFARIFALAESRRREFRRHKLAEFRLTTPVTNIPEDAPLLQFARNGLVVEKS